MSDHTRKRSIISVLHLELQRKINEVGIVGTLKLGACKLISELYNRTLFKKAELHPFDLKYGTDTSGIIEPGALDIPDDKVSHAIRYQTAIVDVFIDIINNLPIIYEDFLFIDLGSGKGRSLLLASHYPFKKIIGVELSATLHRIACQNIQIYRDELQKCHMMQSICEDVVNYEIPKDKILFYLYNPFDRHVMSAVLSNIEDSFHKFHRDIYIAYLKPVCRDLFDEAPFLETAKETERYIIYKNKPLNAS